MIMNYSRMKRLCMKKTLSILLLVASILPSCTVVEKTPEEFSAPDIFASVEQDVDTKTILLQDSETGLKHLNWSPGDELNVFFGSKSVKYHSTLTEYSVSSEFQSDETLSEEELSSTNIWGLYPYDAQATCDGTSISTTLSPNQDGVPGSFDDDLAVMVASSSDTQLFFQNVLSGFKFTLTRDDIKFIAFEGNLWEPLAGSFKIRMNNGEPEVLASVAETRVKIVPKDGDTFRSGEEYIMMLFPGELEEGFTITFGLDNGRGEFKYADKKVVFLRNGLAVKRNLDTYANFYYDVTGITLDRTEASMKVGSTLTLVATVTPENATNKTVTWSSSDTNVATVKDGVVTALNIGTTTITAKASGFTATCVISVQTSPVESVSLDKSVLDLTEGDEYLLNATIAPIDASDKSVTWSSSNTTVASVDSDGLVRALSIGNATITVTTNDGSKTATCDVNVSAKLYPVTGVTLNKTSMSLKKNETETLVATINPANASNKLVSWSSSNLSVATVDSDGMVTGIGNGTAVITVTTADGSKTATCSVTVTTPVSSVSLDRTSSNLKIGESITLKATINPDDASEKNVTWSSSDPRVASVDENGIVTANANGTAIIRVTTKDGAKTATCSVVVITPVSSVSLNKTTLNLPLKYTETLVATINPESATNKNVTWSSSDNSIATVRGGVVTAVGLGTAIITVTTVDGGKTATCTVVVKKQLEDYDDHELF